MHRPAVLSAMAGTMPTAVTVSVGMSTESKGKLDYNNTRKKIYIYIMWRLQSFHREYEKQSECLCSLGSAIYYRVCGYNNFIALHLVKFGYLF